MNLLDPLLARATEFADRPCIHTETSTLGYGQFLNGVLSLSAVLAEAGIRPGQVVAHRCDDELLSLTAMLATAYLGATVFSVSAAMPSLRRDAMLHTVNADILVTDNHQLRYGGLPSVVVTPAIVDYSPALSPPIKTGDLGTSPWLIVTGSGSTGQPKLMPVSHSQQLARMTIGREWLPYNANDCLASLIHLDFYASKQRYLEAFALGASIYLGKNRNLDCGDQIAKGNISVLYATVFHIEQLLNTLSTEEAARYRSLTAMMIGGSTVSARLRTAIRDRLTPNLFILYGTNESHTACISRPEEVFATAGVVGRPFPSTRLEIVDGEDHRVRPGEPGLIRLQTPGMIESYLGDEQASGQFFRRPWFYPGDIGKVTADGQLIHLGRADNMMIKNGINIYPAEIEQQMMGHPGIEDALAVPLNHRIHQDVPVCVVVTGKGSHLDEAALLSYAQARLGSSAPYRIFIVPQVPRNEQGKPIMAEINSLIAPGSGKPQRQLTRSFTVNFTLPTTTNIILVDQWLKELTDGDLDLQLPPYLLRSAANQTALHWLWRCLLLARTLMQAATLPSFQPARILACQQLPGEHPQFQAQVALPSIDNCPAQTYHQVLIQTFNVALWLAAHPLTPANREQLFERIQNTVIKPVMASLRQGKSTLPLLRGAYQRGIPFRHLGGGTYQLGWGAKAVLFDRSTSENDSAIGMRLSANKITTAQLIRAAGLPAPRHFSTNDFASAKQAAATIGWPVVVKPVDGERGEGVTVDVTGDESLQTAFEYAMKLSKRKGVIIEQQVAGVCHRLFIANGELLYGVKRLPMSIVADGMSTIAQGVEAALARAVSVPPWRRSELQPLDDIALATLAKAGLTPTSVPAAGTRVSLRPIETTQWGGVDEEVTENIHPTNLHIALEAAMLFRLQVAGIDIITPDIAVPWHDNGAIINEVNYAPLLGGGDISRRSIGEYLKRLVDGDGTIPVEVFVGGDKAWYKASARQATLAKTGIRVYLSNHLRTLAPDGEPLVLTVDGLYGRARALTLHHDVQHLILVVHNDELLRTGIPLEWIDAADIVDEDLGSSTETTQPLTPQAVRQLFALVKHWLKS